MRRRPPISTRTDTLFPYTTLFRSAGLDDETVFGVDFRAESDSDSAEHQEFDARCSTWLARLPCPSVALVSGPLALQDGFDVVPECRDAYDRLSARSEERCGGQEYDSTGRSRWSP